MSSNNCTRPTPRLCSRVMTRGTGAAIVQRVQSPRGKRVSDAQMQRQVTRPSRKNRSNGKSCRRPLPTVCIVDRQGTMRYPNESNLYKKGNQRKMQMVSWGHLGFCNTWHKHYHYEPNYNANPNSEPLANRTVLLLLLLEFGRFAHRTSNIGNIEAKLNIEKSVASVRRYRCWKKINVKARNVVFMLITLKQHSSIVQTHI